jgi:hypothetical protein
MVLAEQVLLLSRDLRGVPLNSSQSARDEVRWLSVALLCELASMGRLRFSEGRVSAVDNMPTQHTVLTDALNLLHRRPGLGVGDAVRLVADHNPRIVRDICESMVRRGLLLPIRTRRFLLWSQTRYAVQSTRTHIECLEELRGVAGRTDLDDLRVLALYLVCDAMGLTSVLLNPEQLQQAHLNLAGLEDDLTGNRAATDPTLQRARLILILTNPFAPEASV